MSVCFFLSLFFFLWFSVVTETEIKSVKFLDAFTQGLSVSPSVARFFLIAEIGSKRHRITVVVWTGNRKNGFVLTNKLVNTTALVAYVGQGH